MPPFESLFLLPLGITIGWLCCLNTISRLKDDLASSERQVQVLRATLDRERTTHNESVASMNKLAQSLAATINGKLRDVREAVLPALPVRPKQELPFIFVDEEEMEKTC